MLCKRRLCGLPVRQLQFIWNVYAERFDFIIGHSAEAAYRVLLAYLDARSDWDVLVLPHVPSGSRTLTDFPRLAAAEKRMRWGIQHSNDSPYQPLCESWEKYYESLDRKHRSNLRNREKRLRQLGSLSLEVVSSAENLAEALEDGFRLEAAAWKGEAGSARS